MNRLPVSLHTGQEPERTSPPHPGGAPPRAHLTGPVADPCAQATRALARHWCRALTVSSGSETSGSGSSAGGISATVIGASRTSGSSASGSSHCTRHLAPRGRYRVRQPPSGRTRRPPAAVCPPVPNAPGVPSVRGLLSGLAPENRRRNPGRMGGPSMSGARMARDHLSLRGLAGRTEVSRLRRHPSSLQRVGARPRRCQAPSRPARYQPETSSR